MGTKSEQTPPNLPVNGGESEAGISWGQYRWSCLTLARIFDDCGHSGNARYLESLVHGVEDNDPTPLPIAKTMCDELDGYFRKAVSVLMLEQAEDQRELWILQQRMDIRLKQIRIVGMYHAGAGYRTPFGEG